ncbi:MAG: tetratricopeptide repeat protein [Myxococcales bacterium]|nr:tetratricopeptide repeat protein [Myxococcales bacterium]
MSANQSVDDVDRLEARLRDEPRWREFYKLANAYTRVGRFLDAVRVARHGLKHHPRSSHGHVALGRALFGGGNLAGATEVLRQALAIDGASSEPYRLLGEVLVRRELYTEATTLLERAIAAGVDDAKIRSLLERAENALEGESTQVTRVPEPDGDDESRGIGNRAVAGSIGSTTDVMELPPEGLDPEAMRAAEAEHFEEPEPPPVPRSATQQWRNIHESWEEQLDAELVRGLSDTDSDVRMPFRSQGRVELALAPLSDPLAEDMPPLPPDLDDESGVVDPLRPVRTPAPIAAPPRAETGPLPERAPAAPSPAQPFDPEPSQPDEDIRPTEPATLVNQKLATLVPPRAEASSAPPLDPSETAPVELGGEPTQVRQVMAKIPLRKAAPALDTLPTEATLPAPDELEDAAPARPAAIAASALLPEPPSTEVEIPSEAQADEPTRERAPIVALQPVPKPSRRQAAVPLEDPDETPTVLEKPSPAVRAAIASASQPAAVALAAEQSSEALAAADTELLAPSSDASQPRVEVEPRPRRRDRPSDGTPRVVPLSEALDDDGAVMDFDDDPPPATSAPRVKRKRSRAGTLLVLFVLMLAAGGGGTLLWFHLEAQKAAKASSGRALAACVDGSAPALTAAREALAASAQGGASGARDLVAALAWLFHRAGKAPKLSSAPSDERALATAALALASGKRVDAQRALREVKSKDERARALARLLDGYASWLGGAPDAALEALGKARVAKQPLALASLVAGHVRRELGETRAAEKAYRAALGASSRLDLARFALAALALERGDEKAAEAPTASAARAPVGRAWAAVIAARRALKAARAEQNAERRAARRALRQAVSGAPLDGALLSYGAHALIASCLPLAAEEAMERLAKLRGKGDATLSRLEALMAMRRGDARRAAKVLERHEALAGLALLRARALVDAGQAKKAMALLPRASTAPVALLVRAIAAEGDAAKKAAQALFAAATAKGASRAVREAAARLALARGHLPQAKALAVSASQDARAPLSSLLLLARVNSRAGDVKGTLAALARVDGACPGLPQVALTRAELALSSERYAEALAALQPLAAAVTKGAADARVLRALVVAQAYGGQKNQALLTLKALDKHDGPLDNVARGEVYLARGEAKSALAAFKKGGDSHRARVGRARALLALRRYKRAERAALAALRKHRDDPRLHVVLGEARRRLGRRTAARSFQRALKLQSKQPGWGGRVAARAYVGLARVRAARRRKAKDNIGLLERAAKADPHYALAFRLLGAAQLTAKLDGAARKSLRRAVELDGDNATGLFLLGKVERGAKEIRAAWERFLRIEPRGKRAKLVRRALRRLRRRRR